MVPHVTSIGSGNPSGRSHQQSFATNSASAGSVAAPAPAVVLAVGAAASSLPPDAPEHAPATSARPTASETIRPRRSSMAAVFHVGA